MQQDLQNRKVRVFSNKFKSSWILFLRKKNCENITHLEVLCKSFVVCNSIEYLLIIGTISEYGDFKQLVGGILVYRNQNLLYFFWGQLTTVTNFAHSNLAFWCEDFRASSSSDSVHFRHTYIVLICQLIIPLFRVLGWISACRKNEFVKTLTLKICKTARY